MLLHDPASKPTPSWLELILHPFGVGTSHGRPWTHLTHHGLDSGEATTFPHIVLFALLRSLHCTLCNYLIFDGATASLPAWGSLCDTSRDTSRDAPPHDELSFV
jgi:hypothetical protein